MSSVANWAYTSWATLWRPNGKDKYGAIPLNYAITVVKLPTEAAMPVYQYLIDHGSNICEKDNFGKTCLDYAKEYSWRNGIISLMEGQGGTGTLYEVR